MSAYKPKKIFAIALIASVIAHIGFIVFLQVPNIPTETRGFEPIEVVLEPPPPPVETPPPAPEQKKETPVVAAADKAEKDHQIAVKDKPRPESTVLTAKTKQNNTPSEDNNESSLDFGLSSNSQIGPRGPDSKLTKEERAKLLASRQNADSKATTNNPENTGNDDINRSKNNTNSSSPNNEDENKNNVSDSNKKNIATGPITKKEIQKAGGKLQPRDGVVVPFPKNSAVVKYEGLVPGEMKFQRSGGNGYTITATVRVPFKGPFVFTSKGIIENGKFRPREFTDMRKNKLYASAKFDYENKTITYGKANDEPKVVPMEENPQDLFSVAWQVAMNKGQVPFPMQVSTGKSIKHYTPGEIRPQNGMYGQGEVKLSVTKVNIPDTGKATSYYLASDFGYFPAVIIYDGFTLDANEFTLDGEKYWKAENKVNLKSPK